MSTILKALTAGAALSAAAFAFAQGTPPQPAAADPAVGAGQRSSQNTPMGTTGTPGGAGMATQGATAQSGTSGSTSGSTMSSSNSGSSMSSGSSSTTTTAQAPRARADRN